MTLHVTRSGAGPDLVLLHGWALHSGVFGPLLGPLARDFRVHAVDLPGHGRSAAAGGDLRAWAAAVRAAVPAHAVWLGWSLGALVALRAALDAPDSVRALVLVAATPRFTTGPGWPHAQEPEMLERFGGGLAGDFRKTVGGFLALQALGDECARERIRALRAVFATHRAPDPRALADALALLRDTDLRAELPRVAARTLVVAGARDRLTPPAASRALAAALPHATFEQTPCAAHAPFLHAPVAFARRVAEFADAR